jgi:hypothetical protein
VHGAGAFRAYANYLLDVRHLLAVRDRLNQSKGDRGPDAWLPPNQAYRCTYVREWERLKRKWDLTIPPAERSAIDSVRLADC